MEEYSKIKFIARDCHLITQFIRGKLYILVDSILSNQNSTAPHHLKLFTDFFEAFISFSISFLDCLPFLLPDVFFFLFNL